MLSSILLVLLALLPLALSQTILKKMTDAAPWSERAESSAYSNAFPQSILSSSGSRILVPTGSIWVYGGLDNTKAGLSDVWVTTDSAKTWNEVTNIPSDMVVQDMSRTADCYDHKTGRVYAISGSDEVIKSGRTARIAASYDGQHWEVLTADAGFPVRERPGCTVDSQGWVYMFGGSTFNPVTNANGPSNDVWMSKNLGYDWTRITARAPWYMRISADAQTYHSDVLNVDVIYVTNGDGGTNRFQNDVWVSSDSARSWAKVATAPYAYRKDAELTITRDGVLIITGGDDDTANVNDLWASLDGGYTWGACCTKCGYSVREDHFAILDTQGYFYLMGGDLATEERYGNDVWRSTFSFHDLPTVASNCKLDLPSAGAGLRCWPSDDGCTGGGGGGSGSSSSGLGAAAIVGIVAAVLVVLVVGYLGWRYYQKQQAQKSEVLLGGGGSSLPSDTFLGTNNRF